LYEHIKIIDYAAIIKHFLNISDELSQKNTNIIDFMAFYFVRLNIMLIKIRSGK